MKRRALLLAIGCSAIVAALPPGTAHAQAQGAAAFVQAMADRMTAVIDGDDSQSAKAAQLQSVVDQSVDTDEIARFCLGRYWRTATPEQQKAFLQLFHRVLLEGVTGQISAFKDVKVTTGPSREREDGMVVPSMVARPGQKDVRVDWLVKPALSGFRIEDVVAEGTSLRLTRRNDYGAYLAAHDGDVGALLEAIQQRLEQK